MIWSCIHIGFLIRKWKYSM